VPSEQSTSSGNSASILDQLTEKDCRKRFKLRTPPNRKPNSSKGAQKNDRRNTHVLTTALCDQYDKIEIVGL
jgi:hypothetical protein